MNVFAKFDQIPSMILEVIKETKRYGQTVGRTTEPLALRFLLNVFVLKTGMCLQDLVKFHQ